MTVREAEVFTFDAILRVRDWISVIRNVPLAFVPSLERRDKPNDLRYDDCSVNCEARGKSGDVGNQWFVSPDSTPVLISTPSALLQASQNK